ncbi:MAG: GGDEF domain-containing protein [Pseudomonadota bacterium]
MAAAGITLTPLLVVAGIAAWRLDITTSAYEIAHQQYIEGAFVAKEIEARLLKLPVVIDPFLRNGDNSVLDYFLQIELEIDALFRQLNSGQALSDADRALLNEARKGWGDINALNSELTGQPLRWNETDRRGVVAQMTANIDKIGILLNRYVESTLANTQVNWNIAYANKLSSGWILALTVALGVIVTVLANVWAARTVLLPLQRIERGLHRKRVLDTMALDHRPANELVQLGLVVSTLVERGERLQRELEYLTSHDSVTGMYDRGKFQELLYQELQRAKRYNRAFSLLLVSIDQLGDINHDYGRLVGDSVLSTVGAQLVGAVRPTDIAARYGGEEVAIILPETSNEGAAETSDRVRQLVAQSVYNIGDGIKRSITVSLSITTYPNDVSNEIDLFALAERALHVAKNLGGNRVVLAREV